MNLLDALSQYGLIIQGLNQDGQIHRCGTLKKPKGKNGWYVIFDDGKAACFGNWETGDGYEYWEGEGVDRAKVDKQRSALKNLKDKQYLAAAELAETYFDGLPQSGYSDYLKNKRIYPHGARFDGKIVIVPVQDSEGKIWSYQRINNDGDKYFLTDSRVKGGYFTIFNRNVSKDELVVVCEGFATGASIHQETGLPVVVAFNAGNIKAVCETLQFRNLLIAADNDESGVGENAAKDSGFPYVMPNVVSWDFSDVMLEGKEIAEYFKQPDKERKTLKAHGLVGEIADWITATAIKPQPLLSLAAALGFVSMLKGHRIKGKTDLRTNLLIMSIAPTGSGKEFPQNCIRRLADETGMAKHIMGEPVSGVGFLTGLKKAERISLLVMDELGRFLSNLSGKMASSTQKEIIDYIIKSFSTANGTLRGKQYGDDQKRPCIDIRQPSFTCIGSTVTEKLRAACGSAEIIDGFLNRWIVFDNPQYGERNDDAEYGEVPKDLIEKIQSYSYAPIRYNDKDDPILKLVRFSPQAWSIFASYRLKSDLMVKSAKHPMDKLYSRCCEHVEKVALVLSDDEEITIQDIELAINIVEQSNENIMRFADSVSDNVFEQDFVRVRQIIEEHGEIPRNILTRKTQFITGGTRRRDEILEALLDDNLISIRQIGKKSWYKRIKTSFFNSHA